MSPMLTPELLFRIASGAVLPGWLALALIPANRRFGRAALALAGRVLPMALALAYAIVFASQGLGDGGYGSLDQVRRLLANPWLLAAGWLHYLAFDLFVGAWIARRWADLGWPHVLLLPLLALCFLFGPAGLALFFAAHALVCPRSAAAVPSAMA